ncbi:MAG: NusG domain II-containing protein [Firmicutes bacterium]|nr:NusG domain II-containing protein [Bacillota bacterium]
MMKHAEKIDAIKKGRPLRVADYIFFVVLAVAIAVGSYFIYFPPVATPDTAVVAVYKDGEKLDDEYSLFTNGEFTIDNGALTLVIENGAAFVKNSQCGDRRCHRTRITRPNQKIVCLPQSLVIRIERGEKKLSDDDGIHFYA